MKHINVALFVPHLGCPHNCIFCNQKTISGKTSPLTSEEIVNAARIAASCPHDINKSEIAFFGGSFTAIERSRMTECLEAAAPFIGKDFGGIRVSTRPDAIDREVLAILKSYGVTAIELGAQSMDDNCLRLNERGHTQADTEKACALIKEYGFSLGLQMMTGLYGSDRELDFYTARRFIELKPDTVRVYPTIVLENTALAELFRRGEYIPQTLTDAVDICSKLLIMFKNNNINVIRLGLHSGGNVEDGYLAGAYHPAFRELCEARIYRDALSEELKNRPAGNYTVSVGERDISKMTGQKKSNIEYFKSMGYNIKVIGRSEQELYSVAVSE